MSEAAMSVTGILVVGIVFLIVVVMSVGIVLAFFGGRWCERKVRAAETPLPVFWLRPARCATR